MTNNNVTYLDPDGRFMGVYKPVTVTEGYPGRKVPKGRLTIYDAESRQKLFFCLCPRDSVVADSIFEEYCDSRSESASMLDEECEPDAPESNVELGSNGFVAWDCYDGLPYLVTLDGISVNLTYRPAFFPEEGLYRAVADGDVDSFMVEWQGTAERCDWRTPCRIVTLDEYNAENVGNTQAHVSPVVALEAESVETPVEFETLQRGASCAEFAPAVNLFGDRIPATIKPHRQLSLFDRTDYRRTQSGALAVVRRENGEVASGVIDIANRYKTAKKPQFTFTEHETGKAFSIPLSCCAVTWAGDIAVVEIAEAELSRRVSLYGMFASCCLF